MIYRLIGVIGAILCLASGVVAQENVTAPVDSAAAPAIAPPAPVTELAAKDTDNDHGHAVTLTWQLSADDGAGTESVIGYELFRWMPSYFDSVRAMQSAIDSLQSLKASWSRLLPRARRRLSEIESSPRDPAVVDSSAVYRDTVRAIEATLPTLPQRILPSSGCRRSIGNIPTGGSGGKSAWFPRLRAAIQTSAPKRKSPLNICLISRTSTTASTP